MISSVFCSRQSVLTYRQVCPSGEDRGGRHVARSKYGGAGVDGRYLTMDTGMNIRFCAEHLKEWNNTSGLQCESWRLGIRFRHLYG